MKCIGADSPLSLLLLCTFKVLMLSCLLHCQLYLYEVRTSGRASHLNWSHRPFCMCVNKDWSSKCCHQNLCNVNSFWHNSANISGRCAKGGSEQSRVPAAQLYAEEGVRFRLIGLGRPWHRIWKCFWHAWERSEGPKCAALSRLLCATRLTLQVSSAFQVQLDQREMFSYCASNFAEPEHESGPCCARYKLLSKACPHHSVGSLSLGQCRKPWLGQKATRTWCPAWEVAVATHHANNF